MTLTNKQLSRLCELRRRIDAIRDEIDRRKPKVKQLDIVSENKGKITIVD